MPHVRQQIRAAVKALLSGLPTTGARVFADGRDIVAAPLAANELPGLVIDWQDEVVLTNALGGPARTQTREGTVRVRVIVKATSGYLDTIDAICAEIEPVLANNLPAGAKAMLYAGAAGPETDTSSDRPVATLALLYDTTYAVRANDPQTPQ